MSDAARRLALRRIWRLWGLALPTGVGLSGLLRASPGWALADGSSPAHGQRTIALKAQRFAFTPSVIHLQRGQPVLLLAQAVDFIHGLHIPDWNVRVDLMPARITAIPLLPLTLGSVPFLCDNFCGSGHEDMQGQFIISETPADPDTPSREPIPTI